MNNLFMLPFIALVLFIASPAHSSPCPLTDNNVYQDLLTAVDNLERALTQAQAMPQASECKSEITLEKSMALQKTLKDASSSLYNYWSNPETVSENIVDFQRQVQTAVSTIGEIGTILSNNQLISSKCRNMMVNNGGILNALSDLINTISPYVLMSGAMSGNVTASLPVMMGVVGFSSVVKVIDQMSNDGTLDMNNAEHRSIVLKATCQYRRINAKVRYLKLAQTGQIKALEDEINKLKSSVNTMKTEGLKQFDFKTTQLEQQQEMLKKISAQIQTSFSEFDKLQKFLQQKSPQVFCITLGKIVEDTRFDLPFEFVKNIDMLIANEKYVEKAQLQILLENKRMLFDDIVKLDKKSTQNVYTCSEKGTEYMLTLNEIYTFSGNLIRKQMSENEIVLNSQPQYRRYVDTINDRDNERRSLEQIVIILKRLSQDDAAVSKSELNQRMAKLQYALFGSGSVQFMPKAAPITKWLNHTSTMFEYALKQFNESFGKVTARAEELQTSRVSFFSKKSPDEKAQEKLASLNLTNLPKDSDLHREACRDLETAWMDWTSTLDHFQAVTLYCKFINQMIDNKIQRDIITHCLGRKTNAGDTLNYSTPENMQSTLTRMATVSSAKALGEKIDELGCEKPDASVMTDNEDAFNGYLNPPNNPNNPNGPNGPNGPNQGNGGVVGPIYNPNNPNQNNNNNNNNNNKGPFDNWDPNNDPGFKLW